MRVDRDLEREIRLGWSYKKSLVVMCARELGEQLWDDDDMSGVTRDRRDHEAKVAQLGLALGVAKNPSEFIKTIRMIQTPE